jgi:hypothetical protein
VPESAHTLDTHRTLVMPIDRSAGRTYPTPSSALRIDKMIPYALIRFARD